MTQALLLTLLALASTNRIQPPTCITCAVLKLALILAATAKATAPVILIFLRINLPHAKAKRLVFSMVWRTSFLLELLIQTEMNARLQPLLLSSSSMIARLVTQKLKSSASNVSRLAASQFSRHFSYFLSWLTWKKIFQLKRASGTCKLSQLATTRLNSKSDKNKLTR